MSGALSIASMPDNEAPADRLAGILGAVHTQVDVTTFPDGETKVRIAAPTPRSILYCTLDHPNDKLAPLILAASALREGGAAEITLVAPYLCYMRQDCAFHQGEAVSQKVIAKVLSPWFDRIVTIEPHLHRTRRLELLFPGIRAQALSAASLLAELISGDDAGDSAILAGPDVEARAWTKAVAEKTRLPFLTLAKSRHGSRNVQVQLENERRFDSMNIYVIDDVISTGGTVIAAAELFRARGAESVEAIAVHALCRDADLDRIAAAGVRRIRSTDSIAHKTNAIAVAPLLGDALSRELDL